MATVMAASDLLIGKPGGLTTFEALASGLPFVVAEPFLIPGQEEGNADFLVETGIGRRAKDVEQAVRVVGNLLRAPEQLTAMGQAARTHARPDAVQVIIDTLYPGEG
jgi:processive 1,2-diacylglycerol beta-glucosyltransferase